MSAILVEGVGGWFEGVSVELPAARALVVGRSRTCDISIRRAPPFERTDDRNALLRSPQFNRVSRVHFELRRTGGTQVEVTDRSRNGVLVGGERVHGTRRVDLALGPVDVAPADGSLGALRLTVR